MKTFLAVLLLGTPAVLLAECPENLTGRWEQTRFRMRPGDSWEMFRGPYWRFQRNGKVEVMSGLEHTYSCNGNVITVDTPLPTTFEILDQDEKKVEVKVNDGEFGYFVLEKTNVPDYLP